VNDGDVTELTTMGANDVAVASDEEIVGVTEFDASAASSASDDGITCRKRSATSTVSNADKTPKTTTITRTHTHTRIRLTALFPGLPG